MATLSLGVSKAPATATAMPSLGMVAIKVGAATLFVEPDEADRLVIDVQQAAQQLRADLQAAAA
ncbi:hypothetical protein [Stenotrophomonas maltophilia]|uniref:hypothetical protein n=1 Tax=Stenotrophomonas maltophilia TaxID=40324 RepID=UPI000F4EEFC3|nr:hypothetical protein [Stenotrophomonas maltophilia]AYZ69760.1 hypothetical protein EGY09_07070 [Stenotrophomonas maltophilia]